MSQNYRATIVSHTHWDRAWYVPFQEFRARLVRLVDRLIKLLEQHPEFQVYNLDGQLVVLEDYLEVRPQRALVLRDLISQGRITIGPWYVLADEFLVSPEALIRNLMLGHQMGAEFGGVSKIGYVPDGFGHIAQLPQILRGFGIDNAFFWRGVGEEGDRLGCEFIWHAPDGSQVTAIWMPFGYHNLSNLGYPVHWGDTSQMEFSLGLAMQQVHKAVEQLRPIVNTQALLLMNGIDHEEPDSRLIDVIHCAQGEITGVEFELGTLQDHLGLVRSAGRALPSFTGEFRWGRYSEILQGVYSTRIHLKQINHRVETLLERYAEPLSALAYLAGAEVQEGTPDLLWTAWRWLLKNHPHDDIYGSGIDLVHEEMLYRFSQAEQIGNLVVRDSLRQLARQVDFTSQTGMPLLVYNPLAWERDEVVSGDVEFDFDDPTADQFHVVDNLGKQVPCQVICDYPAFWMETLKANRKRCVRVAFPAQVPACGYRAYFIQPGAGQAPSTNEGTTWQVGEFGAENHFLAFKIQIDGSLEVLDKETGYCYTGLNHFFDVEDAGDEYSYAPCEQTQVYSTVGSQARISRAASGPSLAIFRIERRLALPEGLASDRKSRSSTLVEMLLVSEITLFRGQPGIYIRTELDNRARDHKLSAVFPTGLSPAHATVDTPFSIMSRDIDLPNSSGWMEDPTPIMHQRTFTDLSEAGRGLAIFNRGLPAVEVIRRTGGAEIWLTLLRSVGWLSRDDLSTRRGAAGPLVPTPGAQCLGHYSYEYAIFPHSGDWRAVVPAAYNYTAPLLVVRADTHAGLDLHEMNITGDDPDLVKAIPWPRSGLFPDRYSFVQIQPHSLALSALRRTAKGDGLVVRFYNLEREPATAHVRVGLPLKAAYQLNLNEERQESLPVYGQDRIELAVRPAEVVTLELQPA